MTTIVQRSVTSVYPLHDLTFQPRAAPVPVLRDRCVLAAHLRVGLAIGSFQGFLPVSRVLFCSDYGRRNENAGVDVNGFLPVTLDEMIQNNEKFKARST